MYFLIPIPSVILDLYNSSYRVRFACVIYCAVHGYKFPTWNSLLCLPQRPRLNHLRNGGYTKVNYGDTDRPTRPSKTSTYESKIDIWAEATLTSYNEQIFFIFICYEWKLILPTFSQIFIYVEMCDKLWGFDVLNIKNQMENRLGGMNSQSFHHRECRV